MRTILRLIRSLRERDNRRAAPEGLTYDLDQHRVHVPYADGRHELLLRPQLRRLVRHMLVRNAESGGVPVLCSYDELMEAVWRDEPGHTRGELTKLAWELRRRLEPLDAEGLLETERALGYRLHGSAVSARSGRTVSAAARRRHGRGLLVLAGALLVAAGGLVAAAALLVGGPSPRIREFALPFPDGRPISIAPGPGGNLWFTEYDGNKIGEITPAGAVTEYPIPTPNSGPDGIAAGPDGDLWFAESNGDRIGYITSAGSIVQFRLREAGSGPESVAAGRNGAVWFGEDSGALGRISHDGAIEQFPLPPGIVPSDVTLAADGDLWFDSPYTGAGGVRADRRVGRMTPAGKVTVFSLPTRGGAPGAIAAAPDGDVWVAEVEAAKLARITPAGVMTEYPLPTPHSRPAGIAVARDGSVWFTEKAGNKVGVLGPDGKITEYAVPTAGSGPHGIAIARDGAVWFTEIEAGKIARLQPG